MRCPLLRCLRYPFSTKDTAGSSAIPSASRFARSALTTGHSWERSAMPSAARFARSAFNTAHGWEGSAAPSAERFDRSALNTAHGWKLRALCDALSCAFCEIRPPYSTQLGRLCGALCYAVCEIRHEGRKNSTYTPGGGRKHVKSTTNAFIPASLFNPHSASCKTALKPKKIDQFGVKRRGPSTGVQSFKTS